MTGVRHGSPAAALDIQPGDVIRSIDQQPATTPEQAAAASEAGRVQGNILLLVNRHGVSQFVGLSVNGAGSSTPSR